MTPPAEIRVSYVVPVYNGQAFIERCLDSILSQNFQGTEVILVNDGSTDESARILRDIDAKHKQCRVFSQINAGCGAARNTAIRKARGEFLAILDVDDTAIGERSQLQYEKAKSSQADLVVGGSIIVDLERNETGRYIPPNRPDQIYDALLKRKASFHHSSCLLRRSKVVEIGGYRERLRLGGDLDLFYRLFESGTVSSVSDLVVEHTRHSESLSNGSAIEESLFMGVFLTACHLLRIEKNIHVTEMNDERYQCVLQKSRAWFADSRALLDFRFRQELKRNHVLGTTKLLKRAIRSPLSSARSAITKVRGDQSPAQLAKYLCEKKIESGALCEQH